MNIHFYAFLKNTSEKTLFQKGTIVVIRWGIVPWFQRLLLRLHRITVTVIKSYQGIQVTAMKRQKYRKGNKRSENTYKRCVT